jgi:hypothetical protein
MGKAISPMTDFWYTLTPSVKAKRLRALPHSAEFRLRAMQHSVKFKSNRIELLREFEFICKTVLAHELGDPGVQTGEKNRGRKPRETVHLILLVMKNFTIQASLLLYTLWYFFQFILCLWHGDLTY